MSFAFGDYVWILIAAWYIADNLKANYVADIIGEGKWTAQILNYLKAYGTLPLQRSYFNHEEKDFETFVNLV